MRLRNWVLETFSKIFEEYSYRNYSEHKHYLKMNDVNFAGYSAVGSG